MKKQVILALYILASIHLFGQEKYNSHDFIDGNIPSYKPTYNETFPDWAKMLYNENLNFNDVRQEYNKWKSLNTNKHKAVERYYKIWSRKIIPYVLPNGEIYINHQSNTNNELITQISEANNQWSFLGPKETFWLNESGGESVPASCPWQVNIYSFDISKSNDSVLYCGTETAFVSKSVDHGNTWTLIGQNYNFGGGITAVAIDPQNENIVYVAANSQIHKTTNGGQDWTPLLASDGLFYSDKIIISTLNPNHIISAGSSGIYHSLDGGINWTNPWQYQAYDIHFKANELEKVYAISTQNGIFKILKSNDGGQSFSVFSNFPNITDESGGLLAVSNDSPDNIFILLLSSDDTPLLYKIDLVSENGELLATGQTDDFPLENWQGFYDVVFEVSPDDADIMFAGTSSLYKTINGGDSFSLVGGYGGSFPIHPDAQYMMLLENNRAWLATDGGFTFSSDNFTNTNNAQSKNNNLIGSDFWGFDQGWNEDIVVGGRYHNGNTAITDFYQEKALRMGGAESPTGWVLQGKSRHVAFDDLGAGWILPQTAEGSAEGRFPFNKHPNMDEYGGRRGNMVFHPNYYEVIYLGEGNSFWKSSDMGTNFELLHDFGKRVRYLQISFSSPEIIYADVVNEGLFKSEDGGYTWQQKPSLTDGSNGEASWGGKLQFAISPNDANSIYACLNNGTWSSDIGKVFKSTDGGDSWVDWTANLNPYCETLVVQPDEQGNDIVYLFTSSLNGQDANCYIRRYGENNWSVYGIDFPAGKKINHALAFFRDSKLRVAGTGGVWENSLDNTNFLPIIQPWVNSPIIDCFLDTIQLNDHSIIDHEGCSWSWSIEPEPVYIENENIRNPKVVLGEIGSYDVSLTITKNGESYSKSIEDMIVAEECPSVSNCNNPALLPKESWELKYVDSEEVNYPGFATMAFDNDPSTIWHTRWSTGSDPYPHHMEIDLGDEYKIYEFTYQTRQDGENGRIKDFELYFSSDFLDYGDADTIAQFENTSAPQTIVFNNPKIGRYLKLVALSEVNGNAWSSAAEFDIKACYNTTGINSLNFQKLKAFPIPTQGILEISLPSNGQSYSYSLYSISGQLIENGKTTLNQGNIKLDLTNLTKGIYVVKLTDNNSSQFYVKTVKE